MAQLGPYRLFEQLGSGGAGIIYRARFRGAGGFEREVAIKRLLPEYGHRAEAVQALIDEAKLGARLSHGNIAQVERLEHIDGEWIVVLEYVRGVDLFQLSKVLRQNERRLGVPEIGHIGREMLQALQFIHQARGTDGQPLNLVHCDIAPANVMVSENGEVKLIDFGSAKGSSLAELDGSVPGGKLRYRSPEQMRGDGFDLRSDLYSVAIVMWELLAGERVYESMELEDIVDNISAGLVPEISEFRADVPANLRRLLDRALAPNRKARFQTADAFLAALEDAHLCVEPARARYALGELARVTAERPGLEVVSEEVSLEESLEAELGF